jgi:hypothetical protein
MKKCLARKGKQKILLSEQCKHSIKNCRKISARSTHIHDHSLSWLGKNMTCHLNNDKS